MCTLALHIFAHKTKRTSWHTAYMQTPDHYNPRMRTYVSYGIVGLMIKKQRRQNKGEGLYKYMANVHIHASAIF